MIYGNGKEFMLSSKVNDPTAVSRSSIDGDEPMETLLDEIRAAINSHTPVTLGAARESGPSLNARLNVLLEQYKERVANSHERSSHD